MTHLQRVEHVLSAHWYCWCKSCRLQPWASIQQLIQIQCTKSLMWRLPGGR